jgi:hypothetical protein
MADTGGSRSSGTTSLHLSRSKTRGTNVRAGGARNSTHLPRQPRGNHLGAAALGTGSQWPVCWSEISCALLPALGPVLPLKAHRVRPEAGHRPSQFVHRRPPLCFSLLWSRIADRLQGFPRAPVKVGEAQTTVDVEHEGAAVWGSGNDRRTCLVTRNRGGGRRVCTLKVRCAGGQDRERSGGEAEYHALEQADRRALLRHGA